MGIGAAAAGKRVVQAVIRSNGLEQAMSIFGKIMGAIFGSHASAAPAGGAAPAGSPSAPGSASAPAGAGSSAAPAAPPPNVDVAASKELAKELSYTGDMNDSASMNIWLHKQVMGKLAANGGKLPPEIKH